MTLLTNRINSIKYQCKRNEIRVNLNRRSPLFLFYS
nr:MAG TPA: hypothetical protein [Caudoviricetes sp.]